MEKMRDNQGEVVGEIGIIMAGKVWEVRGYEGSGSRWTEGRKMRGNEGGLIEEIRVTRGGANENERRGSSCNDGMKNEGK